jgi:hypothetical protein
MHQEIKGYVPQLPSHLKERGDPIERHQAPLLIRLFTLSSAKCFGIHTGDG